MAKPQTLEKQLSFKLSSFTFQTEGKLKKLIHQIQYTERGGERKKKQYEQKTEYLGKMFNQL